MYAVRKPNPLFNDNRLKLATFCINNYPIATKAPDIGLPSMADLVAAAVLADRAGFEALVAISRWKGYLDGLTEQPANYVLDPFIYAAALSQVTSYSALFATANAPTMHPTAVAKQSATLDVLSGGRFALNVVGGWNRREFDMFGIHLLDHDRRYEHLDEWLKILRSLWESPDELFIETKNFSVKGGVCRPQPLQRPIPIMNAGHSEVGRHFAARNADFGLVTIFGYSPEEWSRQANGFKKMAREEYGKNIQIFSNVVIVQRDTDAEAEEFLDYYSNKHQDTEVVDGFMRTLSTESSIARGTPQYDNMRWIVSVGMGYPLVGSAETVANKLKLISDSGIDGLLLTWIKPLEDITRFTRDVLPILEAQGLRRPHRHPD